MYLSQFLTKNNICFTNIPSTLLNTAAIARAALLCHFQKRLLLLIKLSLHKILTSSALGPLRVDQTDEYDLAPGQEYRQSVTVPSNAFSIVFLLSQWRRADARCRGGDRRF